MPFLYLSARLFAFDFDNGWPAQKASTSKRSRISFLVWARTSTGIYENMGIHQKTRSSQRKRVFLGALSSAKKNDVAMFYLGSISSNWSLVYTRKSLAGSR